MTVAKTGTCGVYQFDQLGVLTKNDDAAKFLGWHLGPGESAEISLHGRLDLYVNGQLVKGDGTILYRIQPDDTYTGVERLRPHRSSYTVDGMISSAPALATDGSMLLVLTPNAGCKGTAKVKVSGTEDHWGGTGTGPTSDAALAKRYNKFSKKQYSVDFKDMVGTLRVLKFPVTAANACSGFGGLYPVTPTCDMFKLAFQVWGFPVGDCAGDPCDFSVVDSCAYDCAANFTGPCVAACDLFKTLAAADGGLGC